ncbi:unnamed protein product [Caenorhabditis brenneri]
MPICEVELILLDDQKVVLRDLDLIKKMPVLVRSMETHNDEWEKNDVKISYPSVIPFPKEAAEFVFEHLRKYVYPGDSALLEKKNKTGKNVDEEKEIDYFPEASKKSLAELKNIIELAVFFECNDFMECMALVIAQKLNKADIKTFAEFAGVPIDPEGTVFDEDDKWLHPVMTSLATMEL